jgi:HKD family nuclease
MGGEFIGNIKDPDLMCVICEEQEGSIRIKDGMVCDRCMPNELMDRHSNVMRHHIDSYRRRNPGWLSFHDHINGKRAGASDISDDRSAFIGNKGILLADELNRDILNADRIDIVVSFIRSSGLDLLMRSLKKFTKDRCLRIITTTYLGATEADAVYRASLLPNTEIRIEYVADESRLHAKAFIFHRSDGKSAAYVGSANISKAALTEGEEWVVRLTEKDVPDVMEDLKDGFERLWASGTFRPFTGKDMNKLNESLNRRG